MKKLISYKIDHLDPMGQGVYKEGEEIYFIRKSLPKESGTAVILKRSKKVYFAHIENIDTPSNDRITPPCPHFETCPSCHYLHTPYEREIEFKIASLKKLLQKIIPSDKFKNTLEVVSSEQRLGYRNRVQIHYDKKFDKIGFFDSLTKQIIPVPSCKVIHPVLQETFNHVLSNWRDLVKNESEKGHIEIYSPELKNVHIKINSSYAYGGFTQVNSAMNIKLVDIVTQLLNEILSPGPHLLELFGGSGNLTDRISHPKIIVDNYQTPPTDTGSSKFISYDIYSDTCLVNLKKVLDRTKFLLLDPPRSGLKNLNQWVTELDIDHIVYVSCNPATLARDIFPLMNDFTLTKIYLFDLFASTYHFETVVYLKRI